MRERIAPDFSRTCDREALLSFQAAADYCFACSDDSSEGDYDITREFFMIKLAEQDDATANDAESSPANSPVEPPANSAAPTIATPTNGEVFTNAWNIQQLRRFYP